MIKILRGLLGTYPLVKFGFWRFTVLQISYLASTNFLDTTSFPVFNRIK
jgi:hypothetical protein